MTSYACNGTPAQKWVFTPGSTTIQVYGKNLCLDAGSSEYTPFLTNTVQSR